MIEDEMVGWHHRHNGHEFEQTLGDSERQGSLAYSRYSMRLQRVGHDLVIEQQQQASQHSLGTWEGVLSSKTSTDIPGKEAFHLYF